MHCSAGRTCTSLVHKDPCCSLNSYSKFLLLILSKSLYILDVDGFTALHMASAWAFAEACGLLIEAGADVNALSSDAGEDPQVALSEGHSSALHVCIANEMDEAEEDVLTCVNLLIKSGADVAVAESSGATPLRLALQAEPRMPTVVVALQAGGATMSAAEERSWKLHELRWGTHSSSSCGALY